jgi:quercetin dioxygenase-like cupin family protein
MLIVTPPISSADVPPISFRGLDTRILIGSEATSGAFALLEHTLAPHALGSLVHTHADEDEVSHVLSGTLGVEIGDEVLLGKPGDTVVKPRGVPHAFWNPGDEPVRFLELISPGGFEHFFAEIAPVLAGDGEPDLAAVGGVMARYSLEPDPASIERLIAEHELLPV